jgi:hypothetical protein
VILAVIVVVAVVAAVIPTAHALVVLSVSHDPPVR